MLPFEIKLFGRHLGFSKWPLFGVAFYRAMHFSANARYWDRMSSVCLSVCPSVSMPRIAEMDVEMTT